MVKVLGFVDLEKRNSCIKAIHLATLLDSVSIAEVVFNRLFAGKTKPKKKTQVTAGFKLSGSPKCTLPWSLALLATKAALDGALHVLDYALQHPVHPVAMLADEYEVCLIHRPCIKGYVDIIHYLIGNPLPLAPTPDPRPLRPGNLSGPSPPFQIGLLPRFANIFYADANPLSTLYDTGHVNQAPLEYLLRNFDGDPVPAATYLLDQGAEPVGLHAAVVNGRAEALPLLIARSGAVDCLALNPCEPDIGYTCTPLFVAAFVGDAESARMWIAMLGRNRGDRL
ncbi:hypothetical protein HDU96_008221 [Phlyctochytrium bullatum]|nr:hypothetical protein HDU96_008221 [Phlyctochytrium bullatum]